MRRIKIDLKLQNVFQPTKINVVTTFFYKNTNGRLQNTSLR